MVLSETRRNLDGSTSHVADPLYTRFAGMMALDPDGPLVARIPN